MTTIAWSDTTTTSSQKIVKNTALMLEQEKKYTNTRWINKSERKTFEKIRGLLKIGLMGASRSSGPSRRGEGQGRVNYQDVENNNNEPNITVNPYDSLPVHTMVDECDMLNNNMTLINNNYMTVSLSPSSTTLTTTFNKLSQKQCFLQQQIELKREESPKKKIDVKAKKEKEKKKKDKKKEKPKTPRGPAGGGVGRGGRGMENQDQMMRRPARKAKQEEK